ncbi:MAG: hypothetical protein ATN36_04165 [Epulopiscium sp. Nele67-Bin005]|nr:MAG: hypothetical protein ATN36_04165 [Epulopiscium sp. Nele67-Bin005]
MKINWQSIKNEDEKLFLKKFLEYYDKSERQYQELYTDFYEKEWIVSVLAKYIGHNIINYYFVGGYSFASRQMVAFLPYEESFASPVKILNIIVKTGNFKSLTHRDYLGSILGLGIERSKIGDIIINPTGAYIIVHQDVSEFIRWHLNQIGKYTQIEINEITQEEMKIDAPKTKEIQGTVASLRADAIFSLAFSTSRSTVSKLLQSEKGRCNGIQISNSTLLKEGDICTLRGYGKFKLSSISGKTKKDRIYIVVEKYI